MGLTNTSTGIHAIDTSLSIRKKNPSVKTAAIAGNPNVGKSTLFNSLTNGRQHTGNWTGKTVSCAYGFCRSASHSYMLVDIPGTYSLLSHSPEEEAARNFLLFGGADAVVAVCDASCLERSLNLVLQILEITKNVLVCVNLLDEADRKGISIDLEKLSLLLGVPVIGTVAQDRRSRSRFLEGLDQLIANPPASPLQPVYSPAIEEAVSMLLPQADAWLNQQESACSLPPRWLALRLLEGLPLPKGSASPEAHSLVKRVEEARSMLRDLGISQEEFMDRLVEGLMRTAESIARETVTFSRTGQSRLDRRLDRI